MSWLAVTMWQLGEVDRARELVEAVNRRAAELGHAPSMAHPLQAKFFLEMLRGDAAAALAAAEALRFSAGITGCPIGAAQPRGSPFGRGLGSTTRRPARPNLSGRSRFRPNRA